MRANRAVHYDSSGSFFEWSEFAVVPVSIEQPPGEAQGTISEPHSRCNDESDDGAPVDLLEMKDDYRKSA